ncbi:GatB/YqeY domain-containing protein [Galactobacillus timonensis]|uniref:GatB/YqeY domain-containing protein n=1 Tax=Galactobacillus timonensis TaxID=2041840 RepID=UPI000C834B94|nr:GatB/YqeY domain-containing protein [Galactobacillus timonensis]
MGELLTQLRKENMQAMKDHDTVKKGVLSLVISSIALAEKEGGKVLTKDEELTYVQRELKQTREALAETPASRQDLIDETNRKIAILESYLPKQMSEDEIRAAIEKIIAENNLEPVKKSQGVIMKSMMAQYKGKIDGKMVSKILGTILK